MSLYSSPKEFKSSRELSDESLSFLSKYTNNPNLEQLREHVLKLKAELAEKLHVYRCIDRNMFLFPRIAALSTYNRIVETFRDRYQNGASFKVADIGCAFGTDTRKLLVDGCRSEDVYAIDVHPGYWDFGLQLFGDKDKLKVNSIFTNVAIPEFSEQHPTLLNTFDFVYTGAVLHVFAKDEVEAFLRNLLKMLVSGGTYFGTTGIALEPTETIVKTPSGEKFRYLHSAESLEKLINDIGFTNVIMNVQDRPANSDDIPKFPLKKYAVFEVKKP